MNNGNGETRLSQLESHLWEAANILRGPVDAADFKTYVFPLLFFKRISDVYDEEYAAALAESGGNGESGAGGSGTDEIDDEKLLREAIALVKRQKGASASLLQRKMRIGYPKAARLIDQMEEMGIIGPPEAAGRLREVLVSPDDGTDY